VASTFLLKRMWDLERLGVWPEALQKSYKINLMVLASLALEVNEYWDSQAQSDTLDVVVLHIILQTDR
jgi:hypothetical protein